MTEDPFADVRWHRALDLGVCGQGWLDEHRNSPFDRFPSTLKAEIPEALWNLSSQSAGVYVDFLSNAKAIFARWKLEEETLSDDPYSAACGRSGLDLYGRDGAGRWQWVGSQEGWEFPQCNGKLNRAHLDGVTREYRLYLPLTHRVLELEIGTRETINPIPKKDTRKPLAYYGTSIVHGIGVSRPGLTHAAQTARNLDREILNLGFSGRAWCEVPVAKALGRLDPYLYIIDVLPNNSPQDLLERLPLFLKILNEAKPKVPKLLLGDRVFPDHAFCPPRGERFRNKNTTLDTIVKTLKDEGMKRLHLHLHSDWYGPEGSSDASHPNDLGAYTMAQSLTLILKGLVG